MGDMAAAAGGGRGPYVTRYCPVRTTVALYLWLGAIHFNAALVLAALLLLPARLAAGIFGVLLFFMAIPLEAKSAWGLKLSRFICKYAFAYFPVTFHVEDVSQFRPEQAYVFVYEPHNVIALGAFALTNHAGSLPLPKMKFLGCGAALRTPFLRHIWTWMGLVSATRKNFCSYLEAGYSCVIVPGGTQEMIYMDHDSEVAFLQRRKGFVRIAVETGRPLVPVFCFGQGEVYRWWKPSGKFFMPIARAVHKIIQYPLVVSWGVYGTPIPYQHPLHLVVGRPIEVKRNPQPSSEEVDVVHGQFVVALKELFEKYKGKVGYPNLHLRIV